MRTFTVGKEPLQNPVTINNRNAGKKCCAMLSSGQAMAVTLINSQQLWLHAQDLHTINIKELLAVDIYWARENHCVFRVGVVTGRCSMTYGQQ